MGKIFYGTQTGTTTGVAETLKAQLGDLISDCKCIQFAKPDELRECDFLVLGGSTWGDGELTDDWQDFLPQMDSIDFSGKRVALFALGDQCGYAYNFVSAMKTLYDKVVERKGTVIGCGISTEGFDFEHSEAVVDGGFVGLVIDEVNESHLTEERIAEWVSSLRSQVPAPSATAAR